MARKHPPRVTRGATAIAGPKYQCAACPAMVSRSYRFCRSDWNKLQSAPGGLRDRLEAHACENPHACADKAYLADVALAVAYLARLRDAR